MICILKIYGFCGLTHQIIKTSWDVMPVTYRRTNERRRRRKVENRAVFWIESETAIFPFSPCKQTIFNSKAYPVFRGVSQLATKILPVLDSLKIISCVCVERWVWGFCLLGLSSIRAHCLNIWIPQATMKQTIQVCNDFSSVFWSNIQRKSTPWKMSPIHL